MVGKVLRELTGGDILDRFHGNARQPTEYLRCQRSVICASNWGQMPLQILLRSEW